MMKYSATAGGLPIAAGIRIVVGIQSTARPPSLRTGMRARSRPMIAPTVRKMPSQPAKSRPRLGNRRGPREERRSRKGISEPGSASPSASMGRPRMSSGMSRPRWSSTVGAMSMPATRLPVLVVGEVMPVEPSPSPATATGSSGMLIDSGGDWVAITTWSSGLSSSSMRSCWRPTRPGFARNTTKGCFRVSFSAVTGWVTAASGASLRSMAAMCPCSSAAGMAVFWRVAPVPT